MATKEEMVKLADEIEASHGLFTMHDDKPRQLGIRKSAVVIDALRRLASSEDAVKGEPEPVAWRWQQPGWNEHWIYNPEPGWLAEQRNIVKQPLYTAPPADAGMREVLREAYTAGALAVHNEWLAATERGEGPPRGEPDFSEAASDYASLTAHGESFVTTNPDGSVTLDAYAGKFRDELKSRCRELCSALNEWQFIAMEAATAHGNCLSNVPEHARTKIANMIEAYRDDDEPGPSDPSPTRSDVTVEELAGWLLDNFSLDADHTTDARALLDQFEIRRK